MNELITVRQLPIIIERLEGFKTEVLERVKFAETCVCDAETVKETKKYRAELNKQFKELDEQRKTVKTQIMEPYNVFEAKYNECVRDIFKAADAKLADKINEVEGTLKAEKTGLLKAYFEELKQQLNLEWLDWFDVPINVTLSVSYKKLRDQVKDWVCERANDIATIRLQSEDIQPELMLEYRKVLNLSEALRIVTERRAALEMQRAQEAEAKAKVEEDAKRIAEIEAVAAKQESLSAPKVETPVKEYKATFTVYGTLEQLKAVKAFLNEGGYRYEC